ncbi:BrnA antitoxin family protein [Pseudochelatococcus sp. B33]
MTVKHKTRAASEEGHGYTKEDWDSVDSPEATDEQLAQARPFAEAFPELAAETRKNLGGRSTSANPKQAISIRLDRDVIAAFKAQGEGWQSRINEALRKAAGLS